MNETNTNNDFKNSKTQSQSLSPISLSSNIKTKSKIETGNNSNSNSSPNNNNEISSIKFNSELSLETNDNYSKYIFDQINKIRTDPQSFIGIIDDSKANIVKNKNGLFAYDGKVKIALFEGESAFDEAMEILKATKPMQKLIQKVRNKVSNKAINIVIISLAKNQLMLVQMKIHYIHVLNVIIFSMMNI